MSRLIKILILGNTGAGKTTLTKHLAPGLSKQYGRFDIVSIDAHRRNVKDMSGEINAKYTFARSATNSFNNAIIECSGVGLTSTVLLNALETFQQINPTAIVQAFFIASNSKQTVNKYHPEEALEYFKEYNPVVIKEEFIIDRIRIIKKRIRKALNK